MANAVGAMLAKLGYDNVGTVEMLRDESGGFFFLEMNTRLQVEHAVTEMVTGIDLAVAQIRASSGDTLAEILPKHIGLQGHAIEARVYAEDPRTFFPSSGRLDRYRPPLQSPTLRVETGYAEGLEVTPFYDPMLAKVIAHGSDRAAAIAKLRDALSSFEVAGPKTNIPFLLSSLADESFALGDVHTGLAARIIDSQPPAPKPDNDHEHAPKRP
jgi:acetyl-CoA carboxylase biotin carboxylase subunit